MIPASMGEPPEPKTVIVLGVRSGTSVTSGMLAHMGVFMGDVWLGPNEYNPRGYFEDADFLFLVNRVHTAHSGSKMIPVVVKDPSTIPTGLHEEFQLAVSTHSKDEDGNERPVWGFKAPSACYLIRFIEQYVHNPHYVLCRRDPIEIASSSSKVVEHVIPEWFDWYKYARDFMITAAKETEGKKRLMLSFHDTIDNPRETAGKLMEFLDIVPTTKQILSAVSLVDKELRHNVVNI